MPFGLPDNLYNAYTGRIRTPEPSYDPNKSMYDTITQGTAPARMPAGVMPKMSSPAPASSSMPLDTAAPVTLPPPIDPNKYKVRPVQTYEQWQTANPEAEGAHEGLGNRLKHGLTMAGLGALQAMASGGGNWKELLARGAGAGGAGLVAGTWKPDIADRYKFGTMVQPADQARYTREAEAANQKYAMDTQARQRQIDDLKVQADLAEKNSITKKNLRPEAPKYSIVRGVDLGDGRGPQVAAYDENGRVAAIGADAEILAKQQEQNEQRLHDAWKTTQTIGGQNWRAQGGWANAQSIAQMNNQNEMAKANVNNAASMERTQFVQQHEDLRAANRGRGGSTSASSTAKTMSYEDWAKTLPPYWATVPDSEKRRKYELERNR